MSCLRQRRYVASAMGGLGTVCGTRGGSTASTVRGTLKVAIASAARTASTCRGPRGAARPADATPQVLSVLNATAGGAAAARTASQETNVTAAQTDPSDATGARRAVGPERILGVTARRVSVTVTAALVPHRAVTPSTTSHPLSLMVRTIGAPRPHTVSPPQTFTSAGHRSTRTWR